MPFNTDYTRFSPGVHPGRTTSAGPDASGSRTRAIETFLNYRFDIMGGKDEAVMLHNPCGLIG